MVTSTNHLINTCAVHFLKIVKAFTIYYSQSHLVTTLSYSRKGVLGNKRIRQRGQVIRKFRSTLVLVYLSFFNIFSFSYLFPRTVTFQLIFLCHLQVNIRSKKIPVRIHPLNLTTTSLLQHSYPILDSLLRKLLNSLA